MILSGPLLTGYTQTLNDWYDREIDAINEPYRPIPSGAIKPGQVREEIGCSIQSPMLTLVKVIAQIWVLLVAGLALAGGLDKWANHDVPTVFLTAVFGSIISYIYSAPPLKVRKRQT